MTPRLLLSLALLGCDGGTEPAAAPETPEAPPPPKADGPNVLLVTLDTTRADHIGAYGYEKAQTPALDSLAERGLLFERAYSPVPLTIPSHSTLFTGLDVYRHHVRNNGDAVLGTEFDTLAERFQAAGYDTMASVGAFVTASEWGFDQGFDAYYDEMPPPDTKGPGSSNQWKVEREGEAVADDVLQWLATRDSDAPFFAWAHFYDPHHPVSVDQSWLERFEFPYDAELAYTDLQVGRLLDAVDLDDTVVAVMADHGEGHGGHAEVLHGLFLYNGTQRVPMILAGPGVEVGVETAPVGLVDVMPTLLHLAGLEVPEGLDGKVQPGNPHPLYLESYQLTERFGYAPHVAIVDGDRKLIDTPRPELYDQTADLREQHDLSATEPETVTRLQELLAQLEVPSPTSTQQEIDADAIAQLQALGYVSGGIHNIPEGDLPDPKDKLRMVRLLQQAERHRSENDLESLEAKLREAVALDPNVPEPYLKLTRALSGAGRHDDAIELILSGVEHRPEDGRILLSAAVAHGAGGKFEDALNLIRTARSLDPESNNLVEVELGALFALQRAEEGLFIGEAWLEEHPDALGVAAVIGTFLGQQGELTKALPFLIEAAGAKEPRRDVMFLLGTLATLNNEPEEAVRLFQKEIEQHPGHFEARILLGRTLGALKRYDEQLEQVEKLLKLRPEVPDFWHGKAVTLLNLGDAEGSLAAAEQGLTLDESHPDLLLMKANALGKLGRKEEGQAVFEQASAERAKREAARQQAVEQLKAAGGPPTP